MNGPKTKLIFVEEEKNSDTLNNNRRTFSSPYYHNPNKIQYNSNFNINDIYTKSNPTYTSFSKVS